MQTQNTESTNTAVELRAANVTDLEVILFGLLAVSRWLFGFEQWSLPHNAEELRRTMPPRGTAYRPGELFCSGWLHYRVDFIEGIFALLNGKSTVHLTGTLQRDTRRMLTAGQFLAELGSDLFSIGEPIQELRKSSLWGDYFGDLAALAEVGDEETGKLLTEWDELVTTPLKAAKEAFLRLRSNPATHPWGEIPYID